ncbi:MAG: DUF58 domain-containing protein [Lachnospiraceae bacterium]|nr:DUF58 domain-containing protein [Lachnospiraceae bacterium]
MAQKINKTSRIRPDYESLNGLSSRIRFKQYSRSGSVADGAFPSVFRGQSMEFEDLRPYIPGDNLRDMDWKASSRSGIPMVRNYVADKRKQIIFMADTGKTMRGIMPDGTDKRECGILAIASAAYLAGRSGADYSILCGRDWRSRIKRFGNGPAFLEEGLSELQEEVFGKEVYDLEKRLDGILDAPLKGVAICLVTDMKGLLEIPERILRTAATEREFYVFEISDGSFDRRNYYDVLTDRMIPEFISRSKGLSAEIWKKQTEYQAQVRDKLRRCGVFYAYLDDKKEIPETVTGVLNGEIAD